MLFLFYSYLRVLYALRVWYNEPSGVMPAKYTSILYCNSANHYYFIEREKRTHSPQATSTNLLHVKCQAIVYECHTRSTWTKYAHQVGSCMTQALLPVEKLPESIFGDCPIRGHVIESCTRVRLRTVRVAWKRTWAGHCSDPLLQD